MMSASDVVWVLGLLRRAGVRFWVDGGWGVDALLGRQTRDHDDLDIALESRDFAAFRAALEGEGFAEAYRDGPFNPVFADPTDRRIDVHLVDTGVETRDGRERWVYGGEGLPYEVGALRGRGEIMGLPVPCCTVESQMLSHTGYRFDEGDAGDVAALAERFGVEPPPEYRRKG